MTSRMDRAMSDPLIVPVTVTCPYGCECAVHGFTYPVGPDNTGPVIAGMAGHVAETRRDMPLMDWCKDLACPCHNAPTYFTTAPPMRITMDAKQ